MSSYVVESSKWRECNNQHGFLLLSSSSLINSWKKKGKKEVHENEGMILFQFHVAEPFSFFYGQCSREAENRSNQVFYFHNIILLIFQNPSICSHLCLVHTTWLLHSIVRHKTSYFWRIIVNPHKIMHLLSLRIRSCVDSKIYLLYI